jgi:tRNA (guanosine-2'-O-)-methyltransferase
MLRNKGYRIVATSPHTSSYSPENLPLTAPVALFFGSEKDGISLHIQEQADFQVKIPMVGFTESLNISVAAAILLYEIGNRIRNSNLNWQLDPAEVMEKRFDWTFNSVRSASEILTRYESDLDK